MATITGTSGVDTLVGGSESDLLLGLEDNDTLTGGDGSDTLVGGAGSDSLVGGAGIDTADYSGSAAGVRVSLVSNSGIGGDAQGDTLSSMENLTGSAFVDTLTGNGGGNVLAGGAGADTLIGNGGSDRLIGGAGADSLIGSGGQDVASYETSTSGVTVDLTNNANNAGGDAEDDWLTGIEHLVGSAYTDTLIGNASGNTLDGGAGDDTVKGNSGNDTLIGGAGADVLIGDGGTDTASYLQSSAGVTVNLTTGTGVGGNAQGDTLSGIERLTGSMFADTLTGNSGGNVLNGESGNDTLIGVDSNDTLNGGNDNDLLEGGAGNDTLNGGGGTDTATYANATSAVTVSISNVTGTAIGGAGTDTLIGIENLIGSAFDDTLIGSSAGNVLDGGAGADMLTGNNGNDSLIGGTGADAMAGNAGDDTYVVDDSGDTVSENASEGLDTVQSSISYTLGAHTENLTLAGSGNINGSGNSQSNVVIGNAGDNTLSGDAGNDTLNGGGGNDTLDGGTGADALSGGAGDDTYIVDETGDGIAESAGEGTDTVLSSITYTLGPDVENLTLTGSGDINGSGNGATNVITGNSGDNTLSGDAGSDTLSGGGGNDVLIGGTGADAMAGNAGDDIYVVDDAGDGVAESFGAGTDTVWSSISYTLGIDVENLTLIGSSNIDGSGNSLDNVIVGNAGDNALDGGAGADTLNGGAGDDTADYSGSSAGVTVSLTTASGSGGDAEGDTLTDIERILGSAFADTLSGDSGANELTGGLGNDSLTGGAGSDTAVFGGARAGYQLSYNSGLERWQITDTNTANGDEGIDTLATDIEALRFSDQTINLGSPTTLPVAQASAVLTPVGTASSTWKLGASGGEGTLSYSVKDGPAHGSLTLNENGTYTYTPTSGYSGEDSFTYRVMDSRGIATEATVNVGVGEQGHVIERSLDFEKNDSSYLAQTPESAGNRQAWTWSGWVKRESFGNGSNPEQCIFSAGPGGDNASLVQLKFDINDRLTFALWSPNILVTTRTFTDPDAWVHIVLAVDTTNAIAGDRARLYVDGVRETSFSTNNAIALNQNTAVNNTVEHRLGESSWTAPVIFFDGQMAEVQLVDGQALDASAFGQTVGSEWRPKEYAGSYGTNGFHLDFADNSSVAALGNDAAGNNDWTVNNFTLADSVSDTPTAGIVDVDATAGNDSFTGGANADAFAGLGGDDQLIGGGGADTLDGGADNDELTGGSGVDTFYFGSGSGADRITDFQTGSGGDVTQLAGLGVSLDSFVEVQAAMTQSGSDVVLDLGSANTITFIGVEIADFHSSNFTFS